jgi:hypothetical protein
VARRNPDEDRDAVEKRGLFSFIFIKKISESKDKPEVLNFVLQLLMTDFAQKLRFRVLPEARLRLI